MKTTKIILAIICSFAVNLSCSSVTEKSSAQTGNHEQNDSTTLPEKQNAEPKADRLTIAMVGDIMMGTTFPKIEMPANDGAELFADCKEILQTADIAIGNLEGAMLDGGKSRKTPGPNCYSFRMPTKLVANLVDAGFDYLGTANNHCCDFFKDGQLSTEHVLDSAGIANSGAAGRRPYAIFEKQGYKIGCISFGRDDYTLSFMKQENIIKYVKELRQKCDILIAGFHAGAEGAGKSHLPHGTEIFLGENRGDLRQLAHLAIDCGADVVFCHGPHVPRTIDMYNNKFIAYSLGNFCTPYGMNLAGICGYAPVITITIDGNGNFQEGEIHDFIQVKGVGPRKDNTKSVTRLISSLHDSDISPKSLTISTDGKISIQK